MYQPVTQIVCLLLRDKERKWVISGPPGKKLKKKYDMPLLIEKA